MKEILLSLVTLLVISSRSNGSDVLGKDGFNYYKDFIRGGRSEEPLEEPVLGDRPSMYYFRTPLQLYPGLLPALIENEYRKRTTNAYKNHMLGKESKTGKRSSKTALSLMLDTKHDPFENVTPYDFILLESVIDCGNQNKTRRVNVNVTNQNHVRSAGGLEIIPDE